MRCSPSAPMVPRARCRHRTTCRSRRSSPRKKCRSAMRRSGRRAGCASRAGPVNPAFFLLAPALAASAPRAGPRAAFLRAGRGLPSESYSAKESLPSRLRSARSNPTVAASFPAASAFETKPSPSMSSRRNIASFSDEGGALAVAPALAPAAAGRKRSCDCACRTFSVSACAAAAGQGGRAATVRQAMLGLLFLLWGLQLACPNIWLHIRTDTLPWQRVNRPMKHAMNRWIALVLFAALAVWQLPTQAQARLYNQAELDALVAPVALYPDAVLSNILVASTYPDDVRQAAEWSRANAQLTGEDAVSAAEPMPWHPSVKALVAYPDLLARMYDSPQWVADLGAAFREYEPYVMDTVQALRRRAQLNGSLQSNDQYIVQQQGPDLAVYPAQPQVVYVPYYD